MRLEEATTPGYKKANAAYYAAPIPEGRMRSQEQTRFATPPDMMTSHKTDRPYSKTMPEKSYTANAIATNLPKSMSTNPKSSVSVNPFDEDDDDNNVEYDESKNPFAEDADETSKSDGAKQISNSDKQTMNPFGEYDRNLNPFE